MEWGTGWWIIIGYVKNNTTYGETEGPNLNRLHRQVKYNSWVVIILASFW